LTSIEGMEINHLHVKLYPYYENRSVEDTFRKNEGSLPTKEELRELADKIRS